MDKFTTKHFIFIISGTSIIALKTYPVIFTRNGGRESWVAVIISSVLIFLFLTYILKITMRLKNYNIYDVYCKALGNIVGKILMILFALTLFFTLVESSSVEANSMHTNMLVETPPWFFLIFFIVPAIYTVSRDKVAIISITIIGIILISIAGTNLAILTAKYKDFTLLFPIFENGITWGFIISVLESLGMYASLGIVLPYLIDIQESNKLLKHSLWGLLFVIQMEIIATTGMISSFDIKYLNTMAYPKLLQTQLVQHFRFLEMGELFVMLQILGGWYIKYILTFYALLKLLRLMNMHFKLYIYVISALVYAAAFFISKNLFILYSYLNIYTYVVLINFF
ncbi:MAG: spore gernimation protein, partial [Clostridiales bacterium GWB2_37_7]